MITMAANEAKQSFGSVLDSAQREPVLIQKHNRPAAVILSAHEYGRLRGVNVTEFTAFCDRVGQRAAQRGLTEKKLDQILSDA